MDIEISEAIPGSVTIFSFKNQEFVYNSKLFHIQPYLRIVLPRKSSFSKNITQLLHGKVTKMQLTYLTAYLGT